MSADTIDYEARARTLKVVRLVLERATQTEREAYARCAGCACPPSDQTWELVIAVLRDREARVGVPQGLASVLAHD